LPLTGLIFIKHAKALNMLVMICLAVEWKTVPGEYVTAEELILLHLALKYLVMNFS
jgi:hypothetical protein